MSRSFLSPSKATGRCSALVFRLSQRRYALPLRATSGVQDLGFLRTIPDTPAAWLGVSEWSGKVLSVLDISALLDDSAEKPDGCLVRLATPHEAIALFISARLGLVALERPIAEPDSELTSSDGHGDDPIHWINIDRLIVSDAATRAKG